MDNESKKPLAGKIAHFWEYNKIAVVAFIFVVLFLVFVIANSAAHPAPDANFLYIGPKTFTLKQLDLFNAAVENSVIVTDRNGDGKVKSDMISLRPVTAGKDEYGVTVFDPAFKESFDREMISGDSVIFIIENKDLYDQLIIDDLLIPLDEIFETVPENAADPFSFKLSDLDASMLDGLKVFSSNALVCARYPRVTDGAASEEAKRLTEYNLSVYRDLVRFTAQTSDN